MSVLQLIGKRAPPSTTASRSPLKRPKAATKSSLVSRPLLRRVHKVARRNRRSQLRPAAKRRRARLTVPTRLRRVGEIRARQRERKSRTARQRQIRTDAGERRRRRLIGCGLRHGVSLARDGERADTLCAVVRGDSQSHCAIAAAVRAAVDRQPRRVARSRPNATRARRDIDHKVRAVRRYVAADRIDGEWRAIADNDNRISAVAGHSVEAVAVMVKL